MLWLICCIVCIYHWNYAFGTITLVKQWFALCLQFYSIHAFIDSCYICKYAYISLLKQVVVKNYKSPSCHVQNGKKRGKNWRVSPPARPGPYFSGYRRVGSKRARLTRFATPNKTCSILLPPRYTYRMTYCVLILTTRRTHVIYKYYSYTC